METGTDIKLLILDIGGILLTDGWDTKSRTLAAERFSLDFTEFNHRHTNVFDAYESGKMTLDEYLNLIIFYKDRPFSVDEFKQFMFDQSQPFPDMIALVTELRKKYNPRILTVSNEPRELNDYRIKTFKLTKLIDFFVSSCYVGLRKPDRQMYEMALSMAQVQPHETLYIDDRLVYIEYANQLGINTINHTDTESTRQQLLKFGFDLEPVHKQHS